MSSTRGPAFAWQAASIALAVAASCAVALLPMVRAQSSLATTDGAVQVTQRSSTLLEQQGAGVLIVLAVPLLLTGLPMLVPRRARAAVTIVCTVLLGVGVLLTGFSIGLFFLPALAAAVVACVVMLSGTAQTPPERSVSTGR